MEGVLEITRCITLSVESPRVGSVVTEQQRRWTLFVLFPLHTLNKETILTQLVMLRDEATLLASPNLGLPRPVLPGPGVAKPQLWQQMNRRFLRSAIVNGDQHENIFRPGFGILHE